MSTLVTHKKTRYDVGHMDTKLRSLRLDDLSYRQLGEAAEAWRTSLSGAARRMIMEHAERVALQQSEEQQKEEAKEAV